MRNIVYKVKYDDFIKLLKTQKIELDNNFIYEGVLALFGMGELLRTIGGLIMKNEPFENIIIQVKDSLDDDISLIYSFYEIKEAFTKTKFSVGVRKADKKLYNTYFNQFAKEIVHNPKQIDETNLEWIDEIKERVDPNLISSILKAIPKNYDNIEKILFIYFELCYLLSYSESFFVNREKNEVNHLDFNNIGNITKDNNSVICWEFNVIQALLSKRFGFNTEIATRNIDSNQQEIIEVEHEPEYLKNNHYSIILDNGEYRIFFDSTQGSLDIDLFNVKTGRNVNGIRNLSDDKMNLFQYKFDKVYTEFLKSKNIEKSDDYKPIIDIERDCFNINNSLDSIRNGYTYLENVDVNEKLDIFKELPLASNLKGMDLVSYLYIYFKKIFGNDPKVHFRIIRTNDKNAEDQKAIVVISYEKDKTRHNYFFDIEKGFYYVDNDSIIDDYTNHRYELVDEKYNLGSISTRS